MTNRQDVDHVLDAIDNALWDWTESPDAMTVRYGDDDGADAPGTLAEETPERHVNPLARWPESGMTLDGCRLAFDASPLIHAARISTARSGARAEISAAGYLVYDEGGQLDRQRSIPIIEDPAMPPGQAYIASPGRPGVRIFGLWMDEISVGPLPTPPQFTEDMFRETMRGLARAAEAAQASWMPAWARAAGAVGAAFNRIQQHLPDVEPHVEQTPRERALEARRNRGTGPARNPHRHRGI